MYVDGILRVVYFVNRTDTEVVLLLQHQHRSTVTWKRKWSGYTQDQTSLSYAWMNVTWSRQPIHLFVQTYMVYLVLVSCHWSCFIEYASRAMAARDPRLPPSSWRGYFTSKKSPFFSGCKLTVELQLALQCKICEPPVTSY